MKTANRGVNFIGGTRGEVDRTYRSDAKVYRQSPVTSDVVIGVRTLNRGSTDLYFVPTVLIEVLDQGSIALSRIPLLKNNYEMFERCKDRSFVLAQCREYRILRNP